MPRLGESNAISDLALVTLLHHKCMMDAVSFSPRFMEKRKSSRQAVALFMQT
jgi:hypothetical protein